MSYPLSSKRAQRVALNTSLVAVAVGSLLAPADADTAIEEIIVTAQKKEQSITDVPLSISATSGARIEQLGVVDLDALSELTPGLVIQEQSPNNPGFVIRGITSDSGSSQASPRVTIYYNGVDISRSRGSFIELFDLERVEVVKGPQATLFGTAASVGAVSIISKKPEQGFDAAVKLGIGDYNAVTTQGFVNGGSDTVQARFAFSTRERDGYIENIAGDPGSQTAGGYQQDDMHAIERRAFRLSFRVTPNERFSADLVFTHDENSDSGTSFKNGLLAPTGGDTSPFSFVEMSGSPVAQDVFGSNDLGIDRQVSDMNLSLQYALTDNITITTVNGLREFESYEIFDADGSQAWFLEFGEDAQGDQYHAEVRINHDYEKLSFFYGYNYFEEEGFQRVPFSTEESIVANCLGLLNDVTVPIFGAPVPCINADGSVNNLSAALTGGAASVLPYYAEFTNFAKNETRSLFADVTYSLTNELDLTAGIRFVEEDKTSGFAADVPNGLLSGGPLLPIVTTGNRRLEAEDSFDDVLTRFNALYRLNDDTNLFATVSKGRRADVLEVTSTVNANGQVVPNVTVVPAEIVMNYEFGIKGINNEHGLSYSASVFYQDYSDFQVQLQDEAGNFFTDNAGSATNLGLEAELNYTMNANLEWFANVALLDAAIDDDSTNGALAGNRFRLQPETTFSAGVFFDYPMNDDFKWVGNATYSYKSDIFFEPDNAPISGLEIAEDAVSLVNLRVGVATTDGQWELTASATNLFDEEYLVDAGNTGGSFGYPTFVAAPPRMVMLELGYRFK